MFKNAWQNDNVKTIEQAIEEFKQDLIERIEANGGRYNGYEGYADQPIDFGGSETAYDEDFQEWTNEGIVGEYEAYDLIRTRLSEKFEIEQTDDAWFVTKKGC